MSFIKARRLLPSKQGYYTEGTASICESVYVTNKTHHSDQKVIENLGSVIYLSEDKKSGIFNSPTRGIVFYDSTNDSFQELSEDDPRLKEASIVPFTKRHVVFGDVYQLIDNGSSKRQFWRIEIHIDMPFHVRYNRFIKNKEGSINEIQKGVVLSPGVAVACSANSSGC